MTSRTRAVRLFAPLAMCIVSLPFTLRSAGQNKEASGKFKVLAPITQGALEVFPVITATSPNTSNLLTLEEGIRTGVVAVSEQSGTTGLVRPRNRFRPMDDGIWSEQHLPVPRQFNGPQVNELAIVNKSDRPLILLAGEIVTGGKQDRVVSRDRLIPPHSEPVALSVFCVEPHRWTGASLDFGALRSFMAQPSVRFKAMAEKNQQEVWNEVAKSRSSFIAAAPSAAQALADTSSYAMSANNDLVKMRMDMIAGPIEKKYELLSGQLKAEKAVGAVVAVNGEIIWADVFASPSLLEKYWPKLIRSYAAEALAPHFRGVAAYPEATREQAQTFLEQLDARNENVETEPGVYRNTELIGDSFDAFVLTGLLPDTRFTIHIAKMSK